MLVLATLLFGSEPNPGTNSMSQFNAVQPAVSGIPVTGVSAHGNLDVPYAHMAVMIKKTAKISNVGEVAFEGGATKTKTKRSGISS